MSSNARLKSLSTALIALEYALADFNTSELPYYKDGERETLEHLVAILADANRDIIDALATMGCDPVNDLPEHHSKH